MNEVILQFAVLWGMNLRPFNAKEADIAEEIKYYDSEELLALLTEWAEDFTNNHIDSDVCDYFDCRLNKLISDSKKEN